MFGTCTRTESVHIVMQLDKVRSDALQSEIETLLSYKCPTVVEGDTLKLTYDFYAIYFGEIAEKLAAVGAICSHPDVVVEAACHELEEGRILAYDVLKKLDNVIRLVKRRRLSWWHLLLWKLFRI